MKAPSQFKDKSGRALEAAQKRVELSTAAAWYVNPASRIPVRVQLLAIRVWLFLARLFT